MRLINDIASHEAIQKSCDIADSLRVSNPDLSNALDASVQILLLMRDLQKRKDNEDLISIRRQKAINYLNKITNR